MGKVRVQLTRRVFKKSTGKFYEAGEKVHVSESIASRVGVPVDESQKAKKTTKSRRKKSEEAPVADGDA